MKNRDDISIQVAQHVMSVTDKEFTGLSVAILAHSFKIGRCKFSRQFKRQTGMTLENFLFKEKMGRFRDYFGCFQIKVPDIILANGLSYRR